MKLNQLLRPLTRRTKRQLMTSANRAVPSSSHMEPLEKRQLMTATGLTISIEELVNGQLVHSTNVNSVGQTVNLDIVASVTGTTAGKNQGLDSVCGSIIGSLTDGNYSVGGDLQNAAPLQMFSANGAQEATSQDLNGDGYLDAGSNDNSDIAGFFNARAGGIITAGFQQSGNTNSFVVGQLTYTVDSLNYGQATDISFRLRNGIPAGAFDAVWQQDGVGLNDATGTVLIGAPFVITDSALTPPPDGSISGTVHGTSMGVSSTLSGVTMFLNTDGSSSYESGDTTVTTNSSGQYDFTGMHAGTYYVGEELPGGYALSSPSSQPTKFVLAASQNLSGQDFIDAATGSISGTINQSLNGNTSALSGITVTLTQGGQTETTATNSGGTYSFSGLAAGSYFVSEAVPGGDTQTSPGNSPVLVSLSAGQANTQNFTDTVKTGSISGSVTQVVNGTSSAFSGVTVYIDTNNSGSLQSGEPTTTTDSNGNYSFTGLPAGTYDIREVTPGGYAETSGGSPTVVVLSAGGVATGQNFTDTSTAIFPGSISGNVSQSVNGSTSAESGVTLYLDINDTGSYAAGDPSVITDSSGNYDFTGLAPNTYLLRESVPSGQKQTAPANTPTLLTIASGQNITGQNFVNSGSSTAATGSISGTVSKVVSGVTSADSGVTVYLDTNNNGSLNSGEPSTTTSSTGTFSFSGLAAGTYYLREVVPTNYSQTSPSSSPTTIKLSSGQSVTGQNFVDTSSAVSYIPGSIAGEVYIDKNSNGKLDSGETGIAGVTMFIDLNLDGTIDSGDPTTVTSSTGAYSFTGLAPATYRVREVVPSGDKLTNPTVGYFGVTVQSNWQITGENWGNTVSTVTNNASISGTVSKVVSGSTSADSGVTVYLDTNNNGTLDSGEPSTVTSSTGTFSFTGLAAGTYHLREVVPSGYSQTSPSSSPTTLTLAAGQSSTGDNFTDTQATGATGSISGEVFSDVNGTGKLASPDLGIPGVTVYIDLNKNGKYDSGEPTTTTSSTGTYSFTGLASGTSYVVRAVPLSGDSFTSASSLTVSVASGANVTGENFGNTGALSLPGTVFNAGTNAGLGGFVVYCDLKNTGVFVASDNNKTTLSNGTFDFVSLKAGTYIIRVVPKAGYKLTSPGAGFYTVVLQPGLPVTGINFAETPTA